jgi:peptidoglycan biosynthesis protein MviN/MurJ (putative lipid II flippase)
VAPFGIGKSSTAPGGVRQSGTEAIHLVIEYVKQETLTPLKGLGRYLLFGIAGSLALCVGLVLLLVALLRALQTETGTTFTGDLSWLPYVIVCAAAIMVIGLAAWRITKGSAARRRPASTSKRGKRGGSSE